MLLRKISKVLLLVVWIVLLVAELIYFVPCKKMIMRISNDGVTHFHSIGNSYASIFEIEESFKVNEKNTKQATCKTVDTPQLITNVSLTTIVAGAIYLLFIYKKETDNKSINSINKQKVEEPPYIDFNDLAFADEETQRKVQQDYAEAMYRFAKNKIDRE